MDSRDFKAKLRTSELYAVCGKQAFPPSHSSVRLRALTWQREPRRPVRKLQMTVLAEMTRFYKF